MKLRLTPEAEQGLFEIAAYLVPRNPQGAQRVQDAFNNAFALIATHPYVGHALDDGRRRFPLPRYPYLVFYRVREDADLIEVFAVRHGARQDEN